MCPRTLRKIAAVLNHHYLTTVAHRDQSATFAFRGFELRFLDALNNVFVLTPQLVVL